MLQITRTNVAQAMTLGKASKQIKYKKVNRQFTLQPPTAAKK